MTVKNDKQKGTELTDRDLDTVSGGLKYELENVLITSYQTGAVAPAKKPPVVRNP